MSEEPSSSADRPVIDSIRPPAAIAGGDFEIRGEGLAPDADTQPVVRFGAVQGRLVVGGARRIVVRVPEDATTSELTVESNGSATRPKACAVGLPIAENLHPVASPAVDAEGNIYTTRSGARGEKVPVSVFKIDSSFNVRPLSSDIVNPTGLAVDSTGALLVSGRNDGTIYSIGTDGETEVYAEGMGVATGVALDPEGNLYVGDRTGTIFKIAPDRQIFVFATLEPSISAYHLAFGPDGNLYVSGPTTSSYDSIRRINSAGKVEEVMKGFGRPQGLLFDSAGKLYVAASYSGRRGIFRLESDGRIEQVVSGPGIVGMAFTPTQEMIVATSSSLFRIATAGWVS